MLSNKQTEIINGSLLGDGTIWTNFIDPLCKFTLTQSKLDCRGVDKKTYLGWWSSEFVDIGCSVKPRKCKKSNSLLGFKKEIYEAYVFATKCNHFWNGLETKWYKPIVHNYYKRKKIIPTDLILTPLTICVWFMDDGSLDAKNGNATFHTQGFTWEECEFLSERLRQDVAIETHIRKKCGKPIIFVGAAEHKKLIELIKPHVKWDCFQYKLDDSYDKIHQSGENHSQSKLTEQQVKEMISLRRDGKPTAEIAKIFNISQANVSMSTSGERWQHLNDFINVKKKPRLTKEIKEQIVALHVLNKSQSMIAKELGVNQSSVSRTIRKKIIHINEEETHINF